MVNLSKKEYIVGLIALFSIAISVYLFIDYLHGIAEVYDTAQTNIPASQSQLASVAASNLDLALRKEENPEKASRSLEREIARTPRPRGNVEITGKAYVIQAEYYKDVQPRSQRNNAKIEHFVRDDKTDLVYEIQSTDKIVDEVVTGAVIKVVGEARSNIVKVKERPKEAGVADIEVLASPKVLGASAPTVKANRKVLVIPSNFTDKNIGCTSSQLDSMLFSGGISSLDAATAEASNGAIGMSGEVTPVTTINFASSDNNSSAWGTALNEYAVGLGYTLADYDTIEYVLPPNGTRTGGQAFVGGSRAWVYYCSHQMIFQHEIGHNLGFYHANTITNTVVKEYADESDAMGSGGGVAKDFNAPHKYELGWVRPQDVVEDADGAYTITALDTLNTDATNPQILKFSKTPITSNSFSLSDDFYVSYRIYDHLQQPSRYRNKVLIHSQQTWSGASIGILRYTPTLLHAVLAPGESYTDPVDNVTFTFISSDGLTASVLIDRGSSCTESAPGVSVTPASATVQAGVAQEYTINIVNKNTSACTDEAYTIDTSLPSGWTAPSQITTGSIVSGDSISKTITVTSPSGASEGSYPVSVIVNDSDRSQTVNKSVTYTVESLVPTASLVASPIALIVGETSTLTWSSTNADSCTGTGFSTGDATSGTRSVTPTTTTQYSVSCTGAGGSVSDSVTVTVTPLLSVSVSATPVRGTAPLEVVFTGSSSGGAGSNSYAWDFGDRNSSTLQNPTYTYNTGGTYTATLTVTSDTQTSTDSVTITVVGIVKTRLKDISVRPKLEGRTNTEGKATVIVVYEKGTNNIVTTLKSGTSVNEELRFSGLDLENKSYDIEVQTSGYLSERVSNVDLSTSFALPTLRAGDLNDDGVINVLDYVSMAAKWFTANADADFNGDGVINSLDFSLMSRNWGG